MQTENKFDRLQRFGVTTVLTLSLVFSFLALSLSNYTANIRAASGEPLPTATPTATPTDFTFPACSNMLPTPGNIAHFAFGIHQIVGGPLLPGSDDVYSLDGGNFVQCFCPLQGSMGIQTNWLRTDDPILGWFFEHGAQWNLGNYDYAAQNVDFSCTREETPAPTPTPTPTPFDICTNIDGIQTTVPQDWYQVSPDNYECRHFLYGGPESAHVDNPGSPATPAIEGYGTGGQVLGASTMAGTGTFAENLYLIIMILGGTLSFLGVKNLKKA